MVVKFLICLAGFAIGLAVGIVFESIMKLGGDHSKKFTIVGKFAYAFVKGLCMGTVSVVLLFGFIALITWVTGD